MKASLTIYADNVRNKINRRLFGHFMEHAGDIIYNGILSEGNSLSDENGFREDICKAIKDSHAKTLRYPGGNFVSNYHWEDGIGKKELRPRVFDYAWLTDDDNRMGTVEFIELCRKVGAEPYICVNMGSGTAEEAMHWVEFCNGTTNTKYANMRRELGYEEPFNVKLWGLGNEMYGDWQFASCSAIDYAKKAKDFAKAMKWVDPTIELVAAGYDLDPDWNRIVANTLKPLIDHIAIHHYSIGYGVYHTENYEECLYLPEYLTKLTKVCHSSIIAGTNDALTNIKVAWDEWNTYAWNLKGEDSDEKYDLRNAILTSLIMHSFLKNSDIVDIASYSPFVNKCGAIRTKDDGLLKRTQYYVFEMLGKAFSECSNYIETRLSCEQIEIPEVIDFSNRLPEPKFSLNEESLRRKVKTPLVDTISAISEDGKNIAISIVNKSETDDCEIDVTCYGNNIDWDKAECLVLFNDDISAANTFFDPEKIKPVTCNVVICNDKLLVKKHSLNVIKAPLK